MTAYEILKYTAWIRGIKRGTLHQEVMNWLTQTDLLKYKDIPIKEYSGGTKRKLNTAIAMVCAMIVSIIYIVYMCVSDLIIFNTIIY